MSEELLTKIRLLPQYYYEKGLILAEQGDLDGAEEQFITASNLQEDYLAPCISAAEIMASKGRYREALYWYDKALLREPADSELADARQSVILRLAADEDNAKLKSQKKLVPELGLILLIFLAFYLGSISPFSQVPPANKELPAAPVSAPANAKPAEIAAPQVQITVFVYTVKKGDTLSKIAKFVYGDSSLWMRIYEANQGEIPNPHEIKVGQRLLMPEE